MRIPVRDRNSISLKKKLIIVLIILILLFLEAFFLNKFFETNTLVFRNPVEIDLHRPISIEKRKTVPTLNLTIEVYRGKDGSLEFEY